MFTTARNLTNLVSADIIYGGGTFYTSPTQFTQFYTLHAMIEERRTDCDYEKQYIIGYMLHNIM
jgi:hypothetical protein